MNNGREEQADQLIVDSFLKTLMPIFSWYISRVTAIMFGCKLILVFQNPTKAFKQRVMESWGKSDQFSVQEILGFMTASGRSRSRKKLKKLLVPSFGKLEMSEECNLFKHLFQQEWNRLAKTLNEVPSEIPQKLVVKVDFAKIEEKRNRQISTVSSTDILDTFPIDQSFKPRMISQFKSEVGNYEDTVRSLWWEVPFNWELLREIGITRKSKIWKILKINPDNKPDMEEWVEMALSLGLGLVDEDEVIQISRWVMGRILIKQFIEQPYATEKPISLDTIVKDEDGTLKDKLVDARTDILSQLEERDIMDEALSLLSPAEREAVRFFLKEKDHNALWQKSGDRTYQTTQRNFERALKKLRDLVKSGKLRVT